MDGQAGTKKILVSVKTVAHMLDLSEKRVQQLANDGVLPKAEHGKYDLFGCSRGYVQYHRKLVQGNGSTSLAKARARFTKISADQKAFKLQVLKGEYLHKPATVKILQRLFATIKQKYLSVSPNIADDVILCETAPEAKDLIDKEIYAALEDLSHFDPDRLGLAAGSTGDTEAPAKVKPKRVGRKVRVSQRRK